MMQRLRPLRLHKKHLSSFSSLIALVMTMDSIGTSEVTASLSIYGCSSSTHNNNVACDYISESNLLSS